MPGGWKWVIDLRGMLQKQVHLETKDGFRRSGCITGIRMNRCKINGEDHEWPEAVEINGDPGDSIKFSQIEHMEVF